MYEMDIYRYLSAEVLALQDEGPLGRFYFTACSLLDASMMPRRRISTSLE